MEKSAPNKKKRKSTDTNGQNKKSRIEFTKESFLNKIKNLKLYTNEDRYYTEIKTDIGPLDLQWR